MSGNRYFSFGQLTTHVESVVGSFKQIGLLEEVSLYTGCNESLSQNISPRNRRRLTKPITRWKYVHNDSGGAWCFDNGPIKRN